MYTLQARYSSQTDISQACQVDTCGEENLAWTGRQLQWLFTKAWQVDRQCHEACQPSGKETLLPTKQLLSQEGSGESNHQLRGYLHSHGVQGRGHQSHEAKQQVPQDRADTQLKAAMDELPH